MTIEGTMSNQTFILLNYLLAYILILIIQFHKRKSFMLRYFNKSLKGFYYIVAAIYKTIKIPIATCQNIRSKR